MYLHQGSLQRWSKEKRSPKLFFQQRVVSFVFLYCSIFRIALSSFLTNGSGADTSMKVDDRECQIKHSR